MLVYFWYPINRIQLYLYDCNTDCTAVIWDVYIIIYIYLSCVGWDINIVIKKQIVKPNAHSHDVCPPHLNDPRWSLITSCNIQFTIVDKQETMHHLECMYIYIYQNPGKIIGYPDTPPWKLRWMTLENGNSPFFIGYNPQVCSVWKVSGSKGWEEAAHFPKDVKTYGIFEIFCWGWPYGCFFLVSLALS